MAFTENKGQWNSNVLYKIDVKSGAMFLEKNCFTYNFVEEADVKLSHAHHHNEKIHKNNIVHYHSYKVNFVNSNKSVNVFSSEMGLDYANFYKGKDPKRWTSNVRNYKKIDYSNIYKNINLSVYISNTTLKYDFIVKPGTDPSQITLNYEGASALYLKNGHLVVATSVNQSVELKPTAYQIVNGDTLEIPCQYILDGNNITYFFPAGYYLEKELIIDPSVIFSTYSGSLVDNWGFTATYDKEDNVYSGGIAFNTGYPTTIGAFQVNFAGGEPNNPGGTYIYDYGCDIAIIKYDPTGTQRLFATYLGGSGSEELPHSLVVNEKNELLVFGTTGSANFPTTSGAYDQTFNGGTSIEYDDVIVFSGGIDIFISKISPDGSSLMSSTYVGGSGNDGLNFRSSYTPVLMQGNDSLYYNYADGARGEIIVDNQNNVYVGSCTFSNNFPTNNAFQTNSGGKQEGVVFKLSQDLSTLIWSSYIGGNNDDAVYSVDVDENYNVYVAGGTNSNNLSTTTGAYKTTFQGGSADGFVASITPTGNLTACSYFGSSAYDQAYFVRTDKFNNVFITGQTKASGSTLIQNAIYNTPNSGQFIAKFNNSLSSIIWSTVFGTGNGKPNISITAFAVDVCNRLYLSGWGREWLSYPSIWPTVAGTNGMQVTTGAITDGQDFYIMVLSDDASSLDYATFFGENSSGGCGGDHVDGGTSRFDKKGNIYQSVCASCGGCQNFPTYPNPGAWSVTNGNGVDYHNCNNAIFKINIIEDLTAADFIAPTVCVGEPMAFDNTGSGTSYLWNFGDGPSSTSTLENPTHTYTSPGTYLVSLKTTNPGTCNISDSITKAVQVVYLQAQISSDTTICLGGNANIYTHVAAASSDVVEAYQWSKNSTFTDIFGGNTSSVNVSPTNTTTYYVKVNGEYCQVIDSVVVFVRAANIALTSDTLICLGDTITLHATNLVTGDNLSYQWSASPNIISGQNTDNLLVNPTSYTQYYLTVTNQYTCTDIESIIVNIDPFSPTLNKQDALCFGICNGQAGITTSGIAPFLFDWSNGQSNASVDSLCIGSYHVQVIDSLGCNKTINFTINQPTLLTASITNTENICDGTCNATATVVPSGGTSPYSYYWINNQTTAIDTNMCAGTYYVTVSDMNGCDTIASVEITDGSDLNTIVTTTPLLCYNVCTGTANVEVTGGTNPYTYQWNIGSNQQDIQSLCAGNYIVTVKDQELCVRVQYVSVTQPNPVVSNIQVLSDIICNGDTGSVKVYAGGGTPSFDFIWNTGQTSSQISGLHAGNYYVTITDSNDCPLIDSVALAEPPIISMDTTVRNIACVGVCNGKIDLTMGGGIPPYTYNWSNGFHGAVNTELCNGEYNVTVVDSKGCKNIYSFDVGISPYIPELDATADDYDIFRGQTTSLHATSNGDYIYVWSPTTWMNSFTSPNPTVKPDQTITYTVSITDSLGCTNIDTVTIKVSDVICDEPYIYVPNSFTPNGDGMNDVLYVRSDVTEDIHLAIFDRWGQKVFETNNINEGWDGTFKGRTADPAVFVYYLNVTCFNKQVFEKKGNITLIR